MRSHLLRFIHPKVLQLIVRFTCLVVPTNNIGVFWIGPAIRIECEIFSVHDRSESDTAANRGLWRVTVEMRLTNAPNVGFG